MKIIKRIISVTLVVAGVFMGIGSNIPVLTADSIIASPIRYNLSVDGESASLWAYVIDGGVYFRLRDVAKALGETRKRFRVTWDGPNNEVYIYSLTAYSEAGDGPVPPEDMGSKTASPATSKVYLNKRYNELGCTVYRIGDSNYLKLSDLAEALDFYMAYGGANTVEIDTSAGYSVSGDKIYNSDNTRLSYKPVTGVISSLNTDLDGDGQNETAELVVSGEEAREWRLVYKDGASEVSIPVFKGNESGFSTSIAAGHMISESSIDFLIAVDYMSMPFGGAGYELYRFQDGVFTKVDVSGITDGTEFDVSVDENKKTAKLTANGSEKTVELSDMALSDYKRYGKGFCQDFFISMKFQSVKGCALPELVTTEVIAAVLPNSLTDLHTTYRYIDGVWKVQSVAF